MFKELSITRSVKDVEGILQNNPRDYYFTANEIDSVDHKNALKSLGARYLIKRAILDHIDRGEAYLEIEIKNDDQEKPEIVFYNRVKNKIKEMGISNVQISISHSRNFIAILVILE
jgi:holo-[acyl-carrier protein] synthase